MRSSMARRPAVLLQFGRQHQHHQLAGTALVFAGAGPSRAFSTAGLPSVYRQMLGAKGPGGAPPAAKQGQAKGTVDTDVNAQAGHRALAPLQTERTFLAIKPDGVQRGLVGEIIARFERKGFKLCALKMMKPTRGLAEAHYAEHAQRPFFQRACRFMCSGPVVAMVWEGLNVIGTSRKMIGPTDPHACQAGTIRGDLGNHFRRNLIHGSDSVESAGAEIKLWFGEEEVGVCDWDQSAANWIYELPNAPITFPTLVEEGADPADAHPGHLSGPAGSTNDELIFKSTY